MIADPNVIPAGVRITDCDPVREAPHGLELENDLLQPYRAAARLVRKSLRNSLYAGTPGPEQFLKR